MHFQHYGELIRQGASGISFLCTAPPSFTLRPAPRVIFGPIPRQFPEWFFGDRGTEECGIVAVNEAELFGDRILSCDGVGLYIPQCGVHPRSVAQEVERRSSDVGLIRKDFRGEWIVLVGMAYQMYGHWLIDFMPRLINLIEVKRDVTQCKYLLPHNIPPFAQQWLYMLGIPTENISYYDVISDTCSIERALIPTGLRGSSRVNPLMAKAVAWIRDKALPNPPSDQIGRRLFISRQAWGNVSRFLVNESELTDCVAELGFETVNPESLSISEQVRPFSSADIVVGDYGSALHSAIFSPQKAMVLALRGTDGHPGFLQSGLCEVLGQDMGYVFGETTVTPHGQSYSIQASDLKLCLDLVLSLHGVAPVKPDTRLVAIGDG